MPKMNGAAVQCCMCITGVFMFLGGIIMMSTGICLILNYGVFDVELLPPDLQNEEGKKTVGIILTSCGLLAIIVSVLVSVLYLCNKTKSSAINPDELSRIPNSARRRSTPDRYDRRDDRSRRSSNGKSHHMSNGTGRSQSQMNGKVAPVSGTSKQSMQTKTTPGSTEVKHPRQSYKKGHGRHRKYPRGRRLEEIKEQDAISRKTMEGALPSDRGYEYPDTPRSGSFCSETIDEQKIPKVVLAHIGDNYRPTSSMSGDSASTSQTSDISNYRSLENDKSRRELQFVPDAYKISSGQYETASKDSISLDRDSMMSGADNRNRENETSSFSSDNFSNQIPHIVTENYENTSETGENNHTGNAQARESEVPHSDDTVISYKALQYSEVHGTQTLGRITPQVGEPESSTKLEILEQAAFSRNLPALPALSPIHNAPVSERHSETEISEKDGL